VTKLEAAASAYSSALEPAIRQKRPAERRPILTIEPGQTPPFFKADILFIHAHPDDEALDFAGLMAKAVRRGKRVVTVLFTDGESGLDQFPHRGVDGTHPSRHLSGGALSAVRVREAEASLSYLGSELYIRFGLKNHPYNTEADVLPEWTIFHHWGTKRLLEERVKILLEGFRPDVVVSSDFTPDAYEHFEHKAVGKVTRAVIDRLRSRGGAAPRGYVVAVDPFQRASLHPRVEKVDMMERDGETGLTYREIQCLALKEHRTQGDASLIGVELLPNFRWETYSPVYWSLGQSLEAYVRGR
jgi:LmbE family N-acetylglucosaminyl deacetylase